MRSHSLPKHGVALNHCHWVGISRLSMMVAKISVHLFVETVQAVEGCCGLLLSHTIISPSIFDTLEPYERHRTWLAISYLSRYQTRCRRQCSSRGQRLNQFWLVVVALFFFRIFPFTLWTQ